MTAWFHWTCDHRYPAISEDWTLQPNPQPALGGVRLVWFSLTPNVSRAALGLTSNTLACDRMSHLLRVVPAGEENIVPWADALRIFAEDPAMAAFARAGRRLMATPGAKPILWGVSADPIRVEPV